VERIAEYTFTVFFQVIGSFVKESFWRMDDRFQYRFPITTEAGDHGSRPALRKFSIYSF